MATEKAGATNSVTADRRSESPHWTGPSRWPGISERGTIVALTETQRIELYERIKRTSLGEEGANLVMNALPNVDWDSIATHDDLALLRSDVRGEMAGLRGEMADLRGEMSGLRSELRVRWRHCEATFERTSSSSRTGCSARSSPGSWQHKA